MNASVILDDSDMTNDSYLEASVALNLINGIVGCLGLCLNLFILLLLRAFNDNTFTTTAIRWLAVYDFAVCLQFGIRAGLLRYLGITIQHHSLTCCRAVWFSLNLTTLCAQYLICCITLERFCAINFPVLYRNKFNNKTAHFVSISVLIFSSFFSVPYIFFYSIDEDGAKPVCTMIEDSLAKWYQKMSRTIVAGVLPVIFVLVGNVCIAIQLHNRAVNRRRQLEASAYIMRNYSNPQMVTFFVTNSVQPNEFEIGTKSKITKMLMAVSFTFVLCHSIVAVVALFFSTPLPAHHGEWGKRYFLFSVVNFFLILSSSLNFFLYFTTNSKFRKRCRNVLTTFCEHVQLD